MSLPDFTEPGIVLMYSIFALAITISLWRGGAPERSGAFFMISTVLIQSIAYASVSPEFWEVNTVALLVDSIAFVGFGAIALNAKRIWPLFAAALNLISLSAHFARQVEDDVVALAYATMTATPTGVVLLLLIFGTISHQRRLKKAGEDLPWTDFELWRELPRAPAQQYVDEHRLAFARGWLGVPTAVCGFFVICYCAAALTLMGSQEIATSTVSALFGMGMIAMIAGLWLHRRETETHSARIQSFREKWKIGKPVQENSNP